MLRIFIDEEGLSFLDAWEITKKVFSYTNHTILPEALEKWSVRLFEELLPRHLMLIYQINNHVMGEVSRAYPGNFVRMRNMSIIEESPEKSVRMAQLCMHGSHTVNGVAQIHSEILKERVFSDFYQMRPEMFQNKTNGITPRLWLRCCNPQLASLITEHIGNAWVQDLSEIRALEPFAQDADFLEALREVKLINKKALSKHIYQSVGVRVSPEAVFDVQIKRLHEYKRQLLNVLGTLGRYYQIKQNPQADYVPRVVIFAGKAAPGYFMAKRVIKLINSIADVINNDAEINDALKVVFLPNYSVSLAEKIIPAADLSEQISTAGFEASGTGNMKFALNGALTIGTMDGATVEMAQEIGEENMFIFGLRADEVNKLKSEGYDPWKYYNDNPMLREVVDSIRNDTYCPDEPGLFAPVGRSLLEDGDPYLMLADFEDYVRTSFQADELYLKPAEWAARAGSYTHLTVPTSGIG